MAARPIDSLLPCPGVELDESFVRRLERLVLRLEAARDRREGAGGSFLSGGGEEFVGYRPYRPGEDLRQLDWNLYARLDQPYVRSTRREASEHWAILIDASASMGVGPPGKLQRAAELAAAFASIGLRQGARVTLASGEESSLGLRSLRDLPRLYHFLGGLRAQGAAGPGAHAARSIPSEAGRVVVLGDFLDIEPRALFEGSGRPRERVLVQILAPVELMPPGDSEVEWVCPETGARARVRTDPRRLSEYARELELRLELWAATAARHGARYGLVRSDEDFEDSIRGLLE